MKIAEEEIKKDYVDSWHHPQKDMNFNLSDLDGQTANSYSNKDRDGKLLYNGQIKSCPDYHGKIRKGKIYHNINNMWWVIVSDNVKLNRCCVDFFDDTVKQKVQRMIPKIKLEVKFNR